MKGETGEGGEGWFGGDCSNPSKRRRWVKQGWGSANKWSDSGHIFEIVISGLGIGCGGKEESP